MKSMNLLKVLFILVLILGISVDGGRAEVNAPSKTHYFTEEEEITIGKFEHQRLINTTLILEDEKVNNALGRILERLGEVSHRPNLKYTITVINDPTPNVFALPGGFIYITTGLLEMLETEDEVAAVLAHEVAHISARHWVKHMEREEKRESFLEILEGLTSLFDVILEFKSLDPESEVGPETLEMFDFVARVLLKASLLSSEVIIKGYGRKDELEADRLAFYYLEEAGFDPWGKISLLEKLVQLEEKEKITYGILSSHPSAKDRISNLKEEQKR